MLKKSASTVEGNVLFETDESLKEEVKAGFIKGMRDGYFSKDEKLVKYDISQIKLPYLQEFIKKYPYFLREYDFGKDDV